MSVSYEVDPDCRLTVIVFADEVSGADMLAMTERLLTDPRHLPGQDCIADMRRLRDMTANASHFQTLGVLQGDFVQQRGARSRIALIAPGDLALGMSRMYAGFSDEGAKDFIMTCDTVEAAADWIGVPRAAAEALLARLYGDPPPR
ncbi:MAG: hypothetical protein V2I63_05805 [Pseudomonadales bacterium]|nr:hypothetical protein [Pseudomonadales bacterium]